MLAPCPTCRRHVDVAPGPCPFCAAPHAALAPRSLRAFAGLRPTRKAATLLASLALAGCSSADETSTPTTDAVTDTVTDVSTDSVSAETGADTAAADSSTTESSTDAISDAADAADVADTDAVTDSGFFPPYGHPPWDEALV